MTAKPKNIKPRLLGLSPVYVGIAHAMRMMSSLAVIKLISIFTGPIGLGQLGFFMSLVSIITVFSGGGIANGVVKYVAEYKATPIKLIRFMNGAILYGGLFSASVLVVSIGFAHPLSALVFADATLWWLLPILGITQILAFVGIITVATVNGLGRQDIFAAITSVAYIGAISVSYGLISRMGVIGGALALATVAASVGCVSLIVVWRSRIRRFLRPRYHARTFRSLSRFSLMMLSAALLFPATEILIRTQIVASSGLETAGLWQGLIRLSGSYIGFFAVYLGTTFVPILSSTTSMKTSKRLVIRQLFIIGGGFAVFGMLVFGFRGQVVQLVFSLEFMQITDVIAWQILGDFFRILSYVIGFMLVAKAATKLYIMAEFFQFGLYLALASLVIMRHGDLMQITRIYAASYAIYFCFMLVLFITYTRKVAG